MSSKPPPLKSPFRRLGDTSTINMRGSVGVMAASSRGTSQQQTQSLQLPAFRIGFSPLGGNAPIGGARKFILGFSAIGGTDMIDFTPSS